MKAGSTTAYSGEDTKIHRSRDASPVDSEEHSAGELSASGKHRKVTDETHSPKHRKDVKERGERRSKGEADDAVPAKSSHKHRSRDAAPDDKAPRSRRTRDDAEGERTSGAKKKHAILDSKGATKAEGYCSNWKTHLKVAAVVVALIAFLAAVVFALVYAGVVGINVSGVGALSTQAALYGMLAGIGLAAILALILGANWWVECSRAKADEAEATDKHGKKTVPHKV